MTASAWHCHELYTPGSDVSSQSTVHFSPGQKVVTRLCALCSSFCHLTHKPKGLNQLIVFTNCTLGIRHTSWKASFGSFSKYHTYTIRLQFKSQCCKTTAAVLEHLWIIYFALTVPVQGYNYSIRKALQTLGDSFIVILAFRAQNIQLELFPLN